jgi:hypothetical protein
MNDTTIIICPDCGQNYDPAIERGEFRSARGVKSKPRVGAQDVRTPGHRAGQHHTLLVTVTLRVGGGWAPIALEAEQAIQFPPSPLLRAAKRTEATLTKHEFRAQATDCGLWFVEAQELEGVAIECGGNAPEFARRVLTACEIVRGGAPWWHAWMQANGIPGETIARGYRVGRTRRADVWLGLSPDAPSEQTPTLRGLL